jgi:hypothetical protein
MVDWDRVEQLRSKGWDWERIAADDRVGFHPDASVRDEGRALRALYHRHRSREGRRDVAPARPPKKDDTGRERRWTLPRIGYLLMPILGIWALLAYLAPSPVGVLLPAVPWLAIGFAVAAFILLFGLLRTHERRWTPIFRSALITGIVLGLVIAGLVGLTSYVLGCPFLPPSSTLAGQPGPGWAKASVSPWQDGGRPVVYFYGASWCPFCSASSWAVYKALSEFGSVTGYSLGFSSLGDVSPGTPEVVLAGASVASSTISFRVSEDTSGTEGSFPGTSDCIEQAYVGAYSGGSIPFVVLNGQYIHGGSTLVNPADLASYNYDTTGGSGASTMLSQVQSENGTGWSVVSTQAWWIMAFLTVASGSSVPTLASQYHWSGTTQNEVASYVSQLH